MSDEIKTEAGLPGAKVSKAKGTKPMAEAKAKMESCTTMAELGAIWMALDPEQRDRGAYYAAKRRIAAAWRP